MLRPVCKPGAVMLVLEGSGANDLTERVLLWPAFGVSGATPLLQL